jgi:hypothetical protein
LGPVTQTGTQRKRSRTVGRLRTPHSAPFALSMSTTARTTLVPVAMPNVSVCRHQNKGTSASENG